MREEVWGENRLADEEEAGWGGITSYNLLDLQVATMETPLFVTGTTDSLTGERRSLCKVSLVYAFHLFCHLVSCFNQICVISFLVTSGPKSFFDILFKGSEHLTFNFLTFLLFFTLKMHNIVRNFYLSFLIHQHTLGKPKWIVGGIWISVQF